MTAYFIGRDFMSYNRSVICMLYFATNSVLTQGLDHFADGVFFCENSTMSTSNGTLFSENYPMNYNNSRYCETNISVNNALLIEISFEYFHTESYLDLNFLNEMCKFDYLEIFANGRSMRLCGDWTGKENRLYFTFNSSYVHLKFRSNENFSRRGFVLKWSSTLNVNFEDRTSCAYSQYHLHETETSCFEVITQAEDWWSGHESCRRRGASLARIEDFQTQLEIEASLYRRKLHNDAIWIGANDRLFEGDYMWPDQTSIKYTNWFPGWLNIMENVTHVTSQPSDDGFSNEDCVEIRRVFFFPVKGTGLTNSFFWNDRNCEEKNPFICQFDKRIKKRSTKREMTVCGETVDLTLDRPSAIVTSPDFPSSYPELVSCHTIVTVPKGMQIFVDFLYFVIEDGKECEFDNVTITESWSKSSSGPFCGHWNQKLKLLRLVSVSNEIVISLHSDNTKQFGGFKVKVSIVDPADLCLGDALTMSSGDVNTSISASSALYNNNECLILVDGTRNYTESVTMCAELESDVANLLPTTSQIVAYKLQMENECVELWSSLTSSSLITTHAQPLNNESLCNITRTCQSTTQEMSVSVMNNTVEVLTAPCSHRRQTVCHKSIINSTRISFTSKSGNFAHFCPDGKNYSDDVMLIHNFVASTGYRIIFKLHTFDIEFQERCLYDFLRTSGMTKNRRFCGKSLEPVTFISEHEMASLEFSTDSDVTACGFNVSWHWIKTSEAFHIRFVKLYKHGFMTSLNYPDVYPDQIDNCLNWIIPQYSRMLLEIHNLTLPGNNCDQSKFEIYSNSRNIQSFCGGHSLQLDQLGTDRLMLLESGQARFCLSAQRLEALDGVNIEFTIVPKTNTTLSRTVTLSPGEHIQISSLMYPLMVPSLITQEITFRTQIGHAISIELHNITISKLDNCSADNMEIIDNSLKLDSDVKRAYSCRNLANETTSLIENVRFMSVLNSVMIRSKSGHHSTGASSFSFIGTVRSMYDSDYLENTKRISGSFDECLNSTCKHSGYCKSAPNNRSTCSCSPHYTGLFCQVSKCELTPCQYGTCNLTDTGFECRCDANYWGELCNMNNEMCRKKMCSGNGQCVLGNDRVYGCLCDTQYTGAKCNVPVSPVRKEEQLTIGQKLLKEPIWIGMIVIVNLVVFFCISYVIRRKCGKKIAKLFPKRNKAVVSASKDNSKAEPSTHSNGNSDRISERNIYSVNLETPKISTSSTWSAPIMSLRDQLHSDSISMPTTPVITEHNQEAAMKLFASYNTKKDQLTPIITSLPSETTPNLSITARNIMSCGIKGGTLTWNREDDSDNCFNETPQRIPRSYTVSTDIRDYESRRSKLKKEVPYRARSYSGTPLKSRSAAKFEQISSNEIENNLEVLKPRHCYPEIRIINEHNMEEIKQSDCEGDCEVSTINIHLDEAEWGDVNADEIEVKPVENTDSGYRSTTLSNTTHSESLVAESNYIKEVSTASERRKMFSSKSKSASFYKIGSLDMSQTSSRRTKYNSSDVTSPKSLNPSSMERLSFDSEMCSSCHRESLNRCSHSYEADLEKLHKHCGRQYSHDVGHHCSRHKRHRRKRHNLCRHHSRGKEIGWYPRQFLFPANSPRHETCMHITSRHMSLSETRDTKRHHRGSRMLNSSTESDSCLCSTHDTKRHSRKHYHKSNFVTEAFSESDCHQRYKYETRHGQDYVPHFCKELKDDDSCKSNLMKSFLSDTYHAKYKGYSGHSYLSEDIRSSSANRPSHTSSGSSMDAMSQNPVPLPLNLSRRSDTVLERSHDSVLKLNVSPLSEHNRTLSTNDYSGVSFISSDSFAIGESQEVETNIDDFDGSIQSATYISSQANPTCSVFEHNFKKEDNVVDGTEIHESCAEENEPNRLNALMKLKDSAYQTKQSSLDKFKGDKSLSTSGSMKSRTTSGERNSNDATVRRYLHQAALKLALLKRLQSGKEVSKDSAINTFSEDDMSADEKDTRGTFRPLIRKTSGSLAFQLGEMSLSEVKEEHSGGLSKDTESYNTPNNEPVLDTAIDRMVGDSTVTSIREMHEKSKPHPAFDSFRMDETKV